MDKLSTLFIVKGEHVTGVYNHCWILYKYEMLEYSRSNGLYC